MLDATTALLTYQAGNYFTTGEVPARLGNRHPTIVPYECFETADGDLVIAGGNDGIWRRLCQVLELPAVATDPRFATNKDRVAHYDELRPELAARLKTRTRAEWAARFGEAGVPCGSVREVSEVLADPQLAARGMIAQVEHPTVGPTRVIGSPVKLSDTPPSVRTAPPMLGQHVEAILAELGYDASGIQALRAGNVV